MRPKTPPVLGKRTNVLQYINFDTLTARILGIVSEKTACELFLAPNCGQFTCFCLEMWNF